MKGVLMGQAAVDLPDPSEVPNAPANGSADDLLSQLAGDEIDRLLSEAEVEKGPPPSTPPVPPIEQSPLSENATADEIDRLFAAEAEKALAPASPAAAAPAPAAPPPALAASTANAVDDAAAAAQIDALFKEVVGDKKPAEAPAPAHSATMPGAVIQPQPAEPEAPAPVAKDEASELDDALAKAIPQIKPADSETSAEEKNALADALKSLNSESESSDAAETQTVPFYLKPLIWLNMPMELLPEVIREAVGKIALMTLANSLAILIYVFLFRKHH
jgi:hypothetical protein